MNPEGFSDLLTSQLLHPEGHSSDWLKTNPDKFSDLLTSQLLHPRGIQQIQKLLICQAALDELIFLQVTIVVPVQSVEYLFSSLRCLGFGKSLNSVHQAEDLHHQML